MDPSKLFEDLTWADLIIIGDELNAIREFDSKMLEHQELRTVCGQLKIKGVKNAPKEANIQRIVAFYKIKDTTSLQIILMSILQKQDRTPSVLTG